LFNFTEITEIKYLIFAKKITTMKNFLIILFICFQSLSYSNIFESWKAKRITAIESQNESNSWTDFRRDFIIETLPSKALTKIACDSKYWLWINGELVIFEGQLKRGPTPEDTYYDEIDIAPFLKKGQNSIAVLVWFFGKDGFSHKSSGVSGLVFQCDALNLASDEHWSARLNKAFDRTDRPDPNYRLPESNVKFDARAGNFDWIYPDAKLNGFGNAKVIGEAESSPWNRLILRPVPMWKDYGVSDYVNSDSIPAEATGEWIECRLPYNCHITPILDIYAPAGLTVKIQTDNFDYMGLNAASVRAEYVTRQGRQQYESPGWMNGHVVKYYFPEGVKIYSLKYRETGFNCEFTGYFKCSDEFYTKLWQKARRTLYVTMRDTYMDCPDRERAQWWGDLVNESGEAFYALSPSASTLTKKGILELINWQRGDSTIYSPIPQGNWDRELPGQMLASIGYYGFWNYYMNTGDIETIKEVYNGVKKYLNVWKLKPDGTLTERHGDWYWGDWGQKIDKQLLYNNWYYLALKGYQNMAEIIGDHGESQRIKMEMKIFKEAFNRAFWDGTGYRTKEYEGTYDDRAQALAVVSGLADKEKYNGLLEIFKTTFLASPYMEKYVLEALFMMGEPATGLERMKKRYFNMVELSPYTTLYENFGDGPDRSGSGTNNHAWSGGGLTILSQYVCGLEPLEPAWTSFRVKPQLGTLSFAETGNETIAGKLYVKVEKTGSDFKIELKVPSGSDAIIYIPNNYKKVTVNNITAYNKGYITNRMANFSGLKDDCNCFLVKGGTYIFTAR
jgi:alpha-L-rhamnosidase